MKKNILVFILITMILTTAIISCQQKRFRGYRKTDTGLLYKFVYRSGDTVKPKLNGMITVKLKYGTEDTTLYNSDKNPRPLVMQQRASDYKGDIYEAFSMMSRGDSAIFILQPDSFYLKTARNPRVPPFIDSNDVMVFHVKMLSIQTKEQYQAAQQARHDSLKANEMQKLDQYIKSHNITATPTASGLYFMEKTPGSGSTPTDGQWVKLNFAVTLLDGTPVYSSFNEKPAEFEWGKPFENKGFTEAVGMMKKGVRADLIVPSDLAFADRGKGGMVPPFATLLYDVQIVDIMSKQQHDAEQQKIKQEMLRKAEQNKVESKRFLEENAKKPGVVTLPDGLQYKIIKEGTGPKPTANDEVKINYKGTIINGTVFDNSYDRGEPSVFKVNGVIQGWSEALQMMPVGSHWILYIPPELAYRDNQRGRVIEPNMALIFDVELVDIVK